MNQSTETGLLDAEQFSKLFNWLLGLGLVKREEASASAYWKHLHEQHRLPYDLVRRAMLRAPSVHTRYFPTAGEIRLLCDQERLDEARHERSAKERSRCEREYIDSREYYADVPPRGEERDAWIADAPNVFEKLGRIWKAESCERGLDPNKPTPRELRDARMTEFWTLWDRKHSEAA